MMTMTADLYTPLKKYFGYDTYRDRQEEIITSVLAGRDALVIMPTGGGKSLCYQIPGIVAEGLVLVLSPLIALMDDQVIGLRQMGVRARAMHSHISETESDDLQRELAAGELDLLYVSPERLMGGRTLEHLTRLHDSANHPGVAAIAIDEAHCVSIWGNDFRPEYVRLSELRQSLPGVPIIALTATADSATQSDISKQLDLQNPLISISSFERKNITTLARAGQNKMSQIVDFVSTRAGESGIIYCLSRKNTEQVASKLTDLGYKAKAYHAGLAPADRKRVQADFTSDKCQIVCATIAFGMGIDKSNIRWIIHHNMPKNIESYYQEIGRAGRDGAEAEALLFYSWRDIMTLRGFIEGSDASGDFRSVQMAKLDRMWEYANASSCRTNLVLNYFGEYSARACGHCDNCLHPPESLNGTVIAQKALSAITRCRENLGMILLIDHLRGSARQEILRMGLDRLSTYGVGREHSFRTWKGYLTQMVNQGLIAIDYTSGAKLRLTPLSSDILKGKRAVLLHAVEDADFSKKSSKRDKEPSKTEQLHEAMLTQLRVWRGTMAKAKGIPAYMIFHDSTLEELASKLPKTANELAAIQGIGDKKLADYGTELLDHIQTYLLSQDIMRVKGSTQLQTLSLWNSGMTVDEIANLRQIKADTVGSHLAKMLRAGELTDLSRLLTEQQVLEIRNTYDSLHRPDSSKLVVDELRGKYEYYQVSLALHGYADEKD